ncbi:MAG: GEVED domain-containing protein, partial [Bacteroidales bacterium]
SYEWIAGVEVGSFSNSSSAAGYTDFTSKTVELQAGNDYEVSLTPGFASSTYNEYWKIWIDYNNDKEFTSDELVFDAGSVSSSTVNGTISIPSDITSVTTRMRVSMKYDGAQTACETFEYGEVEDYTVTITSGSGEDTEAPTAPSNLTSSNVTETTVDLGWDASTDNVGVTGYDVYQNGSLISSVDNNSANVTGLTASTTYEFYVKAKDAAGNVSDASNTISVTTSDESGGDYCASQGDDSSYEWIAEVNIDTYSNSSGAAGYTDFTGEEITLNAGSSVDISLVPGFSGSSYNEYWKIWIDYNGDKEFTSDELVFDAGSLSKTTVNGTINISSTASGTTRMRVSMKYNGEQTACETFSYGEVEDYTVTFTSGGEDTEAPSAPTNLTSSNITQTSVDLSWNASTDNVGVAGYDVYQNGSLFGSVEDNSANVTGLTAGTIYEFYVKAKDAAGNVSDASNTISVTTLSDDVEYCESKGNNSSYEWIDLVELNEMSNATGDDGGYADYTSMTATVSRDAEQTIYVSCGFSGSSYTEYWHVWIDWDHSGTFDADEEMVSGSSSSADKLSATFTVPSDAQLGNTRMRVTMKYNAEATACESFSYGEVEDYTINVTTAGSYSFTSFTDATELGNEIPTDISVYPNPAIDDITVTVENGTRVGTISIYNMIGSLIKIEEINGNRKEIDISDLPAGSYIISVEDEKEPLTKQIIKQ